MQPKPNVNQGTSFVFIEIVHDWMEQFQYLCQISIYVSVSELRVVCIQKKSPLSDWEEIKVKTQVLW